MRVCIAACGLGHVEGRVEHWEALEAEIEAALASPVRDPAPPEPSKEALEAAKEIAARHWLTAVDKDEFVELVLRAAYEAERVRGVRDPSPPEPDVLATAMSLRVCAQDLLRESPNTVGERVAIARLRWALGVRGAGVVPSAPSLQQIAQFPGVARHAEALEDDARRFPVGYHEIRLDEHGEPDDIVLQCDSIQLERLDEGVWWLAVSRGDQRTVITLGTKRGAPIRAVVTENALAAPEVVRGVDSGGVAPVGGETRT